MLFSSMTFIYVFLPILLLLYISAKKELHNFLLLAASIVFYAWGEPKYLAIMLLTILINYFAAVALEKTTKHKKSILVLTIIANLSFLIYFKYFNFLIENYNHLFYGNIRALDVVMPIGISFYTFQALSYVIDVYRKECQAQKNIYKLALYICLFPQLIAGPIVKYHDVADQIEDRKIDFDKVNLGVKRFIVGLAKKVLIANTMGGIADKIFSQSPHDFSPIIAWLGSLSYTFQLYFDFSGYSDMAIGLGLIFGFRFMENFNYPYISKSITEFWRRWHISLSTWFKQYVYISLGGNRNGQIKTIRNLGIVFLLTGIWHGAQWTFVVWGVWHGLFIILEKIAHIKEFEAKSHAFYVQILRHLYCVLVFIIGWVIFRADDLGYAFEYVKNMFWCLPLNADGPTYTSAYYIGKLETVIFVVALLCSMPIFKNMLYAQKKSTKLVVNTWLLVLFYLSTMTIVSNTYNPFIYFRF